MDKHKIDARKGRNKISCYMLRWAVSNVYNIREQYKISPTL